MTLQPRDARSRQNLGDLYLRRGRPEQARAEYRQATRLIAAELALNPEDRELALRHAVYLAKAGDCKESRRELAELLPRLPADNAQFAHLVAWVQALCGSREEALAAVRRAIALGFSAKLIRDEDEFRAIAGDPEFVRLTTTGVAGR